MDGFEGDKDDPQSLHKYLYAHGNPVNSRDPSGNDVGEMLAVVDIGFTFFAQISTAALPASVRQVPDPSWEWMYVTVDTAVLYGGEDKTERDFRKAEKVYAQARIHVKRGASKTIGEDDTKKLIGNDLILDGYQQMGKPTREELAVTKGQNPEHATAYYVQGLSRSGSEGYFGEAFNKEFPSPPYPAVVVANGANYIVMSHELGHILWEDSGINHFEGDRDNLMSEGAHNSQAGTLTWEQCWRMRKHRLVHSE
jgi:hypothetical protein